MVSHSTEEWPLPRDVFCNNCLSHTNLCCGKSVSLLKAFPVFHCIFFYFYFLVGAPQIGRMKAKNKNKMLDPILSQQNINKYI